MIRNIVFAGCSFTWGQSLHFFQYGDGSDNIHPLDGDYYENKLLPHHYQYNVDNRFPTIVSDYFGRKPIVDAHNGGSTESIYKTMKKINNLTDAVIVQTTQFHRSLEVPKKIKDKSIKILGMDTFHKITSEPINRKDKIIYTDNKYYKYLACSSIVHNKHNLIDEHFSPKGHRMLANEIIKNLEKVLKKPKYDLI